MEIKKIFELNEFLDIYGNLLTKKQYEVMIMYYEEDLSLGEISEELKISRQAVYDTIKKSQKLLYSYEKSLNIRENNFKFEAFKKTLLDKLSGFKKKHSSTLTEDELYDIKEIMDFCKENII